MATDFLKSHTLYFNSFEAREEAFNRSVSHLIACKYNGPQRFWREFNRIIHDHLPQLDRQTTAYITSNPRDCLAFGTTRQVLAAARISAGVAGQGLAIEAVAREFDLSNTLDQPIRTLSGGETVKLALAKSFCMAACSRRLSIASPFCWLSRKNAPLLEKVVGLYLFRGLPVAIYALEGEDDLDERPLTAPLQRPCRDLFFDIVSRNAGLSLGRAVFDLGAPPQYAALADAQMRLCSPCLIQGDNGQGKSLLAKALSGAVKIRGHIGVNGRSDASGLLFQDVINQTLLRSFKSLAKSVGHGRQVDLKKIFNNILETYYTVSGEERAPGTDDFKTPFPSLLLIKILLTAVRLCGRPSALILDEPDWGLTRRSAEALVRAVVCCAHDLGVPVLIISHKPWWNDLARSSIWVEKGALSSVADAATRFTIFFKTGR